MYYYLDDSRKPQGPFSKEQLVRMVESGELLPSTLIAKRGSEEWLPISKVISECGELPPVPEEKEAPKEAAGACPYCSAEVYLRDDGSLPVRCAKCDCSLRPNDGSIIATLAHSWTHVFTLKGRATRQEFWLFVLSCIVATAVIGSLFGEPVDEIPLIFYLLGLSLCVRRLHDTGSSGYPILWMLITCILPVVLMFSVFGSVFIHLATSKGGFEETFLTFCGWTVIISCLLFFVSSIFYLYVLIRAGFIDSERGPNRFGPSAKYPLPDKATQEAAGTGETLHRDGE